MFVILNIDFSVKQILDSTFPSGSYFIKPTILNDFSPIQR